MKKIKIPMIRVTLILLGFVLVTSHMSAGLSAKFSSKLEGSDDARVAQFAGGSVAVTGTTAKSYSAETVATEDGYHIFAAEATVTFPANEVSREFTLTITTDDPKVSLICPTTTPYILEDCTGSRLVTDAGASASLTEMGISNTSFESGKAYVYIVKNEDGTAIPTSVTYSVLSDAANTKASINVTPTPIAVDMGAESYTVRIIYFKSFNGAGAAGAEANISFGLRTEQVD